MSSTAAESTSPAPAPAPAQPAAAAPTPAPAKTNASTATTTTTTSTSKRGSGRGSKGGRRRNASPASSRRRTTSSGDAGLAVPASAFAGVADAHVRAPSPVYVVSANAHGDQGPGGRSGSRRALGRALGGASGLVPAALSHASSVGGGRGGVGAGGGAGRAGSARFRSLGSYLLPEHSSPRLLDGSPGPLPGGASEPSPLALLVRPRAVAAAAGASAGAAAGESRRRGLLRGHSAGSSSSSKGRRRSSRRQQQAAQHGRQSQVAARQRRQQQQHTRLGGRGDTRRHYSHGHRGYGSSSSSRHHRSRRNQQPQRTGRLLVQANVGVGGRGRQPAFSPAKLHADSLWSRATDTGAASASMDPLANDGAHGAGGVVEDGSQTTFVVLPCSSHAHSVAGGKAARTGRPPTADVRHIDVSFDDDNGDGADVAALAYIHFQNWYAASIAVSQQLRKCRLLLHRQLAI